MQLLLPPKVLQSSNEHTVLKFSVLRDPKKAVISVHGILVISLFREDISYCSDEKLPFGRVHACPSVGSLQCASDAHALASMLYDVAAVKPLSVHFSGFAVASMVQVCPPADTLYSVTPACTAFGTTVTSMVVGAFESPERL